METFYAIFGTDSATITWWQAAARAVLILIYAVALYRIAGRRVFGRNTALDIVVYVILGSTLSRALTANAPLLPTFAATAALLAGHSGLSLLARKSGVASRLIKGTPVQLIRDARIDWRNARSVNIGEGDLNEALRLHGVGDVAAVRAAFMERNGKISIIKRRE
jgi:uncharacterized membrane protein YcaP (DUF421 family)